MDGMNRAQRRAANKQDRKNKKSMWPGGYCEVPIGSGLKPGQEFTIAGVRRNKDGTFITSCKSGEETVFVAK